MAKIHHFDKNFGLFGIHSLKMSENHKFVCEGSFIANAAPIDDKKDELVWFIKVTQVNQVDNVVTYDDYNHNVPAGVIHHTVHFLEKQEDRRSMKKKVFGLSEKKTHFYNENIVYPYVNMHEGKKGLYKLMVQDYVDILVYIENDVFPTYRL